MARCLDTSTTLSYSLQYCNTSTSKDSSIDIATDYGLDGRSSMAGVRFPARIRNISLLYSVHTGFGAHLTSYPTHIGASFPWYKSGRGMKLTTHLHLLQRSRMMKLQIQSVRLHGVVLNSPSTWINYVYMSHTSCERRHAVP
jgi:hypothetical protein